ncbi:hypothetical protein JOY44_06675 [Phormidium sp. CLA17]|uniref:DUF6888 family protein n=1 Tax=Leptolyngbya sp. Cla-17 TaxID=2803751 RepID=UPI001490F6FC|nr:hypothetical protein [Leptolyngbya sp. Cla-17]MBM0741305.1 hypothetical protein [Leptolyngbya sp. Cla-17]
MLWTDIRAYIDYGDRMHITAQALKCFQLCCDLTNKYCSIDPVTLDKRTGQVVILSKEEINIEIDPDGDWRFV